MLFPPLLSLLLLAPLTTAYLERFFSTETNKPKYNLVDQSLVREIDQLRRDWGTHGAAVAVVRQGEDGQWIEDVFGVGVADGEGNAVTENTLFAIASNSKLFTAVAAGLIIANETATRGTDARLTSTTKIKDVVPEWGLMDLVASEGTDLVDLLCKHDGFYGVSEDKTTVISRLRHLRPSTEFRRSWQYNNLAYVVASTFSEHLYGIPFTQYVQDNVFTPLGMSDTSYAVKSEQRARRSDSFVRRNQNVSACVENLERSRLGESCQGEVVNIGFPLEGTRDAGAGGVITTAKDMATWLKVLLLQGRSPFTDQVVIPHSILTTAATPFSIPHQPPTFGPHADLISPKTYGMGQQMYTYRGHYIIEHGGADPGQMSQVMRIPGKGLGVAIMVNDNEFGTAIDWAAWVKAQMMQNLQQLLPPVRPVNATMPEISLESIPGTYVDNAYGEIVICAITSVTVEHLDRSHLISQVCRDTLAKNPFPASEPHIPALIARFDKLSSNYLLFTHHNGSVFTVTPSTFYPETNATVVSQFESFKAIFNGEGMAFAGNAWGAGPGVERDPWEGGLREGAEVWFQKE